MNSVLFLGNSMLSSLKLAYDEIAGSLGTPCRFFCARGADLYFTEVADGRIRPVARADIGAQQVFQFYPEGGREVGERYAQSRGPLVDVGKQFKITGGAEDIDLAGVGAIFYVAGVSPYDFVRLGESPAPVSRALRHALLSRQLDETFLLRPQITSIKAYNPNCKHYFIGSPLAATTVPDDAQYDAAIIRKNREIVRSLSRRYIFDDIFMPDEDLLDETLTGTKAAYCRGGRREAVLFQRARGLSEDTDQTHMNKDYGLAVFDKFIAPLLAGRSGPDTQNQSGA